jgi:branched-chain amino acid transport system permease protein
MMSAEDAATRAQRPPGAGGWHEGWSRALALAAGTGLCLLPMPAVLGAYPLFVLSHMLVLAIACLALNLLYGTAGSLSLGHAACFGGAAYAGAFVYRFTSAGSFEVYLASGLVAATVLATVIGFLCARSSRIFFALLTLSFSMVVHALVVDGAVFRLLGGVGPALYQLGEGSMYIPRLTLLGADVPARDFIAAFYLVIVVAFLICALVLWRIGASPFGQALRAIRDNELRAAFIGIPVWQYRWRAFVISGVLVGLAGSLYGQLARQITPEQLHWLFSAQLVLAIVLGGSRHFLGPVLGAFLYVLLDEIASHWAVGRSAIFGALLIVAVLAVPRGMAGGLAALGRAAARRFGNPGNPLNRRRGGPRRPDACTAGRSESP